MKFCTRCNQPKEQSEFRRVHDKSQKGITSYLKSHCKTCEIEEANFRYNRRIDKFMLTNSISIIAGIQEHEFLNMLITEMLKEAKIDWKKLRSKKVIYKNQEFDLDMWNEEYIAVICAAIYQHAPFANRIDFLAKFTNRTINQVKALISIHYKRYNAFIENDNYTEIYVNFYTEIGLYFEQFYKIDYGFKYKEK